MAATKRWRRKLAGPTLAKRRAEEKEIYRQYASGEKVRRWESPKKIREHGRDPWPAKVAAAHETKAAIRSRLVSDRYPTGAVERHRAAKKARAGKTTHQGTWTLRKANVSRDKKGQFAKRKKR